MLVLWPLEPILCSSYALLSPSYAHLMQSWLILSSHAVVLESLGPLLGCSSLPCNCKNTTKYKMLLCFSMFSSRSYLCFWWPSGALLGCFLDSLLAPLGSLRLPCGLSWAFLGSILGYFRAFLGLSWQLLCLSWPTLRYLWPTCALGGLL